MHYEDERIAVEKRLLDSWSSSGLASSVTVYVDEGVAVTPPANYIVVSVVNTDAYQKNPGSADKPVWHRIEGFIQVDVYCDPNKGASLARRIADAIQSIYGRQKFSYGNSGSIVCRDATRRSLGRREGKSWEVVRVPFYRDVLV